MSASLRFAPMPLGVLDEPFDHDDSIFELKYDGFRALAHVDSGPLPPHFPQPPPRSRSLCSRDGRALPGQFVPDGEILYTEKPRRFPSRRSGRGESPQPCVRPLGAVRGRGGGDGDPALLQLCILAASQIAQMLGNKIAQAQSFIQLAHENHAAIRSDP